MIKNNMEDIKQSCIDVAHDLSLFKYDYQVASNVLFTQCHHFIVEMFGKFYHYEKSEVNSMGIQKDLFRQVVEQAEIYTKEKHEIVSMKFLIEEVDRELRLRKKLYPKWIQQGRMHKAAANYQYQRMSRVKKFLIHLEAQGIKSL